MDTPRAKKHKRSGSVTVVAASPSVVAPRSMKRSMGPRAYGKFQASKKHSEKKNLDTDIAAAGLSTVPSLATATVYCLNLLNTGSSGITTVGRRVIMKSLLLRASIRMGTSLNAPAATASTSVRVMVVYDRQPNGSLATIAQLLGATTYGTASPLSLANSDRFTILLDEKFGIPGCCVVTAGTNVAVDEPAPYFLDRYVKVGLPCEANGSAFTGAISGIATGGVFLLAWSDIAAANSPPVVDCAMSRIRYIDG